MDPYRIYSPYPLDRQNFFYCIVQIMMILSLLLFVCCLIYTQAATADNDKNNFAVAGYLPDYRFYIPLEHVAPLLTDLYLFSIEPSADGTLGACCLSDDQFRKARSAKFNANKNLNLWLTIGGGGSRSQGFIAAMRDHPKELVISILQFASQHSIAGIDIDCEAFSSQEDFKIFVLWLMQYAVVNLQSAHFKVSIALHANMILPKELFAMVDRINLMAYDMLQSSSSQEKGHSAMPQVKEAVTKLVEHGCDAHKIILGIPAYSRKVHSPSSVKTFAELVDDLSKMPSDSDAIEIGALHDWMGYKGDSPETVAQKVAYAKEMKLGGVFFWELGQDKQVEGVASGGYLLEAAAMAAGRPRENDREEL